MCIRDWEKDADLYAAIEDSVAFYDCEDMVVFVKSDNEATQTETGKAAILNCLDKYGNSPVKNIEVQVASLRPFACKRCGNIDISAIANFCIICGTSVSDKQSSNNGKMVDILNYADGPKVDNENRFTQCPICKNSEFSDDTHYCRICGRYRINLCEGYFEEDGYGNHSDEKTRHNNPANARFCEVCGRETEFFQAGILKPWESIQGSEAIVQTSQPSIPQPTDVAISIDEDDDLPF